MEKAGGNYGTGTKEMQVPFIVWQLQGLLGAATAGSGRTWNCQQGRGMQSGDQRDDQPSRARQRGMHSRRHPQRVCHHTETRSPEPSPPQERNYVRRKEQEKEREQLFEGALKKFNAKDIEGVRN